LFAFDFSKNIWLLTRSGKPLEPLQDMFGILCNIAPAGLNIFRKIIPPDIIAPDGAKQKKTPEAPINSATGSLSIFFYAFSIASF